MTSTVRGSYSNSLGSGVAGTLQCIQAILFHHLVIKQIIQTQIYIYIYIYIWKISKCPQILFLKKTKKKCRKWNSNFLSVFFCLNWLFLSCDTRKESLVKYRTVPNISFLPCICFAQWQQTIGMPLIFITLHQLDFWYSETSPKLYGIVTLTWQEEVRAWPAILISGTIWIANLQSFSYLWNLVHFSIGSCK